ncbi:MAG TPA: heme lyase CcmF/NrfE family subunit [Rhizomicrobium sp.]|nr:heme lyase CcmF/NrfE family subunit [Rhizomicrobium sp.]
MTAEIGQLSLTLALALSLVLAAAGLAGARVAAGISRQIASSAAIGLLVFIVLAFGALEYAAIVSDFSILNVADNSSLAKPMIYKITGVWGNHEGSMLLWLLVLALYTAAIAFAKRGSERLTSAALGVQGLLAVAFLVFILFTSNPFLRIDPPPFDGNGLNPLLQDLGLAIHPPTLYIGYVGFSASFAYAAAALITREFDASWARAARPFMLAAWIALTLGITLGSWWAYYELGWGGFWFWDPVENASLMPWLVGTALLHSALATERTGAFRTWTLLLSIAAFSLSLIGTFLVRSGVLTSVHAFANDPERGAFILIMLILAIGGALGLFAWRAPSLETGSAFEPVSRETAILTNNVLLVTATATVFLGTLYPLFLEAFTGTRISVGPPFFAVTFVPVFVALLMLLPIGPRLAWRKSEMAEAVRPLMPALGVALVAAAIVSVLADSHVLVAAGAFGLAGWVIAASLLDLFRRRVKTAAAFAVAVAHAGLGITLMGIAGTTLWRAETLSLLGPGETAQIGPYTLTMVRLERADGSNYAAIRANIRVSEGNRTIATLTPAKRIYPTEQQETVETAIRTTGVSDLYLALGDERGTGRYIVRAYYNPLAPFIWFGGAIMALGGLTGLWGRIRARNAQLAPNAVPAE